MLKLLSGLTALLFTFAFVQCSTISSSTTPSNNTNTDTPTVDSSCNSTVTRVKKYLLDAGYDENATAGIMGNLMEESGANISLYAIGDGKVTVDDSFIAYDLTKNDASGKTFSGGFGIAQWTYWSKVRDLQLYAEQYANNKVVSETAQFGYLVQSLREKFSPSVMNNRRMEDVTWVIRRSYEIPNSVSCTEQSPCYSYSFTCEAGYPCRYTGKVSNGKKQIAYWNSVNTTAEKTPYDTIVNNKKDYWAAWLTLESTINYASSAKKVDISSCSGSTASTDPENGGDDNPYPTTSSTPDSSPNVSSGAIGAQSSNNFYRQDSYKSTAWRGDGSTINSSGCSLIAMANAMKSLGMTSESNPASIAGFTRGVISGEGQTGWGNSSMSIDRIVNRYNLSQTTLYNGYSVVSSQKLSAIRSALSSGKAVVAGGQRKAINPSMTSCPDTSTGDCVFSYNGHFVAIVGITADDKLVIANPARGNGRGNVYPATTVLKYSNKAIAITRR